MTIKITTNVNVALKTQIYRSQEISLKKVKKLIEFIYYMSNSQKRFLTNSTLIPLLDNEYYT